MKSKMHPRWHRGLAAIGGIGFGILIGTQQPSTPTIIIGLVLALVATIFFLVNSNKIE